MRASLGARTINPCARPDSSANARIEQTTRVRAQGITMSDLLTRADWYANGRWDASHSQDPGSVREYWRAHGRPMDARELVTSWWRARWDESAIADWIDQQYVPEESAIGAREAFAAWSAAWADYAIACVRELLPEWVREHELSI